MQKARNIKQGDEDALIPDAVKLSRFLFKDKSETLSSHNMSAVPRNDVAKVVIISRILAIRQT